MTDKFISGSGGGGKGGGGGSRTPSTDEDSLNSRSYGRIVDLISEGQIQGLVDTGFVNPIDGAEDSFMQSIFLDNTPLQNKDGSFNFDDVIVRTRSGTASQSVIGGFVQAANVIPNPQSNVQIDATGQTFPITDESVDSIVFLISVPQLQKIKNNGDTLGTKFSFKFQRSLANGAFSDIKAGGKVQQEITGRTPDLYQKQYEFNISNFSDANFPISFKIVRTGTAGDTNLADDTAFMNADDDDGEPNSDTYISHTSAFFVSSTTLVKEQGKNFNGTFTHNDGDGGNGKIITITTSHNHNLEVGDSIGCEFVPPYNASSNPNQTKNRRMEVASVINRKKFTCEHFQTKNNSGNVKFGRRFNYPNSALVGLRINAEQFNSVPKRSYFIKGIKVRIPNGVTVDQDNGRIIYPANYVYNGSLGAAQWTTDPAWCLYDLLTSERYGCGDFIKTNQLDRYSFYAASVYSSELVSFEDRLNTGVVETITEPRFSLNVNIQTRQDVFKVVNSLCSVFRAMPLYMSGNISLIQDKEGITPSYLFTYANVTKEGFTYSGSSSKTRATVVVVKYFDNELRDAAYEQVLDTEGMLKYGAIVKNINSFGVTSRSQARRLAKWLLVTLATETDIVSFTTTISAGALITPGQIIEIQDKLKSGVRRGGQITGVETANGNSRITIDSIADLPVLTGNLGGTLTVILPDGQLSERAISNINTTTKKITVAGRFRKKVADSNGNDPFLENTLQENPVYTNTFQNQDPNVGSFWVVETTGTNAAIQSQLYKVISVEEEDDFTYTVTAVLHNESKYAAVEENETLEHRDVTNLDLVPTSPTGFAVDSTTDPSNPVTYPIEQLYKEKNQVKVRLLIAWKPVIGINRYELQYRKNNTGWRTVELQDPTYSIDDINVPKTKKNQPQIGFVEYDIRVKSISASGKKSKKPLTLNNKKVRGKNTLPSRVSSDFSASLDPHLGIVLSWTPIEPTFPTFSDLDIKEYRIYEGSYGSGTKLGEFSATSVIVPTLPSTGDTTKTYSIKAIDQDGNESNLARTASLAISIPRKPETFTSAYSNDNLVLNWSASVVDGNRFAIQDYDIFQGSTLIATTNATTLTIPVTWSSAQTFKVEARDIIGKLSGKKSLAVPFAKAAAPNISYTYEGSKVRLSWAKPAEGATKIKDYIIRSSADNITNFNAASNVDVINSESYLFEVDHEILNTSTPRRFFVAARDVNNTVGDVGRTGADSDYPDVTVSPPPAPNNLTATVVGVSAFVDWDEVPKAKVDGKVNGLPIAFYKIYRANQNANQSNMGAAKFQQNGTSVTEEVVWSQVKQKYFVRAVDINGNEGLVEDVLFEVTAPSQVTNFNDEVIDNNVLLRWSESTVGVGQLPIAFYNIYKIASGLNTLVGQKLGTFTTVFEQVGGTFEYKIFPVNTAGHLGASRSVIAEVDEPPDFILKQDHVSDFSGTKTNGFLEDGGIFYCIDTSRTWKQHFDPNNNDTSRTFGIYGSSTPYALPTLNSGLYRETIDTGATIAKTKIEATVGFEDSFNVGNGLSVNSEIETAPDNGSGSAGTFTTFGQNKNKVIATNFRFIRVTHRFEGANNDDLAKVSVVRTKTFLKQFTDQGNTSVTLSDVSGGKLVTFNKTFIDVDSITLQIRGSTSAAKYAIYDFEDTANPSQGFRIYLFDNSGNPVPNSGASSAVTVDFTVRGV